MDLIMGIIIVSLITVIGLLLHALVDIKRQLIFRKHHDTNIYVTSSISLKPYTELCNELNHIMDEQRKLSVQVTKKETEMKETLAHIAHDIRTPLTTIQGYLKLIEECHDEQDLREYHKIIEDRLSRVKGMLEAFFMYVKLSNDDYQVEMENVLIYPLCCEVLADFYQPLLDAHIVPELKFEEKQFKVLGNHDMVMRIIQNLILNTVQHSNGMLQIQQKESSLIFINPITQNIDVNQIFDRFYKADQVRSKTSSGLGLTIVKELMELQGGQVYAEILEEKLIITLLFKKDVEM